MSHAVYDTRYHLVWAPKYRKWILDGEVRDTAKELFKEILAARDCEVIEMEIAGDHVHIFASIRRDILYISLLSHWLLCPLPS
jgi:putative transposase